MTRRVLITGGSGFIGRQTLEPLHALGFEVHAIGRSPVPGATLHPADLLDAASVRSIVTDLRASHLLHLAWYVEPGAYWHSPRNLDWLAASLLLARAFVDAGGRRIVAAGTCAEYAWGTPVLHEETTPCIPATLYGASKDALRRALVAFGDAAGVSVAWARLFFLYGPGEAPGRLVSDAIRTLAAGGPFQTSHGRQRRDFIHVADAAQAFAALLDSTVQGPVNIASGTAVPVRSVLEHVARHTGGLDRIDFGARTLAASEPDTIEAAVDRLRQEVGFHPRFDLAAGIADTVGAQTAA